MRVRGGGERVRYDWDGERVKVMGVGDGVESGLLWWGGQGGSFVLKKKRKRDGIGWKDFFHFD